MRAIPAACVPTDNALRTHCCICLSRAEERSSELCASCGSALLCARCARSDGARLIHEDECPSLVALFAAPAADRPKDTCSLRLLLRLLLWRWRCKQPDAAQYVGDEWWGDGDACDVENSVTLTYINEFGAERVRGGKYLR